VEGVVNIGSALINFISRSPVVKAMISRLLTSQNDGNRPGNLKSWYYLEQKVIISWYYNVLA
jgi:hypothetical protein